MKRKNLLNASIGFFSQGILLVFGLVIPRVMMTQYGSDTNGLTSTITQIFTYLALLEAGVSQASRNALFPFVQKKDKNGISTVMSASRYYYRKTSLVYLACVVILAFILPVILKTNVDYTTVMFSVLFEGLTNVVSFYFINNWKCLLLTTGEGYVINIIELISKTICYLVKIILAMIGLNIALIQVSFFVVSLVKMLAYYMYMRKKYPWVRYYKEKEFKLPDRNAYVISEIAWVIFSATDMIVLSVFVSTALSSVYSIYSMVFSSLSMLLNSVYTSINFNLGQAFHKNILEYEKTHDLYNLIFVSAITILVSTAYLLIIPFINLYTEGVNDISYVYGNLPLFFCLIQLLSWSRYVTGNLTGIAGYAKPVSNISILEAIINVVCSIALVQKFGIVGVVMATVIALPIKVVYCTYICDVKVMNRKCWNSIRIYAINYTLFFFFVILSKYISFNISSYFSFFIHGACIVTVISVIVFGVNLLLNNGVFSSLKGRFKSRRI